MLLGGLGIQNLEMLGATYEVVVGLKMDGDTPRTHPAPKDISILAPTLTQPTTSFGKPKSTQPTALIKSN